MGEEDLDAVAQAIARAEANTAAEIRIHLDHRCPGDPVARAIAVFEGLGMHRTEGRNGVLVYAAIADRKLAIIGDQQVHARVGDHYWREVVAGMTRHLADNHPRDGFMHAIGEVGSVLSRYFPRRPEDRDELSNRVSVE